MLEYYDKCKEEDVRDLKRQLEALGEYVDNKLQSDRLFLYFMQFGKCAYSGMPISLERLMAGSKEYDIDHIYPQAYVKDDSIINNKVLVLSVANGEKRMFILSNQRFVTRCRKHGHFGIMSEQYQMRSTSD